MAVCYTSIWLASLRAIFTCITHLLLPVLIEMLIIAHAYSDAEVIQ